MPLSILNAAIKALKNECFKLAKEHNIFLQVDEAGNIWLGDTDHEECSRVRGWHLTHQKIQNIISKKEMEES